MIACDRCGEMMQRVSMATPIELAMTKVPPPMNPADSLQRKTRKKPPAEPTPMVTIRVDCCEDCTRLLNEQLVKFVEVFKQGGN
jgi:hypothetical protein